MGVDKLGRGWISWRGGGGQEAICWAIFRSEKIRGNLRMSKHWLIY